MNDANFETRLAKLERAARWYRVGFFAVCVLAVGMGAKFAVQDAEFGVVKATNFQVVSSDGKLLGEFRAMSNPTGQWGSLSVAASDKKQATVISPGKQPLVVNND